MSIKTFIKNIFMSKKEVNKKDKATVMPVAETPVLTKPEKIEITVDKARKEILKEHDEALDDIEKEVEKSKHRIKKQFSLKK